MSLKSSFFGANHAELHEPQNRFTTALASAIPGISVLSGMKDDMSSAAPVLTMGQSLSS